MRLFVAVELDRSVLAEAQRVVEVLRDNLRAVRPKWVPVTNMHLTVRFIGHVAEDRVRSVIDALAPSLEIGAFDLTLGQCGVFPPRGGPRVLWIGLEEGLAGLRQMHEACNRRLVPLGLEPEDRPFSAHLTLARIKDAPRGSAASVHKAVSNISVANVGSRVSEAVLFESRLSPNGATYQPLLRVPLRS